MGKISDWCAKMRDLIVGDPLPPERVAAGWALGMFVGCAIPFGLQLVVSVPLAVAFRISKIGASVGTLLTNPLTIFFIYPAQTIVAYRLIYGGDDVVAMPTKWTMNAVMSMAHPFIISFFVGGLMLALILTPITYFTVRQLVRSYRHG